MLATIVSQEVRKEFNFILLHLDSPDSIIWDNAQNDINTAKAAYGCLTQAYVSFGAPARNKSLM